MAGCNQLIKKASKGDVRYNIWLDVVCALKNDEVDTDRRLEVERRGGSHLLVLSCPWSLSLVLSSSLLPHHPSFLRST